MKPGRPSELVLFVDVNFWDDPKVRNLTPREQNQWLRILAEQLKSGNGACFPFGSWGLTRGQLERYIEAGLLVSVEGELHVHKWDEWNGREAYKRFLGRERVRRLRARRQGDL